MKNLKLILSVLVLAMGVFSFVNAQSYCEDDWYGFYDCQAWEICPNYAGILWTCTCDNSYVLKGKVCWTQCIEDPLVPGIYDCNEWQYCPDSAIIDCNCPAGPVSPWGICSPSPTPPLSCSYLWQTLYIGQSMNVYQNDIVPNWSVCNWLPLICINSGGIGTLIPLFPAYSGYNFLSCIELSPLNTSCDIPGGSSVVDWTILTWYSSSSVSCGSTCDLNIISCVSGSWSGWTYSDVSYSSCSVWSCGWWGWSYTPTCDLEDLICVDGIYEEADWVNCRNWELWEACELEDDVDDEDEEDIFEDIDFWSFDRIWDISGSPYSEELNLAYLYAYNMWITTMENIFLADLEWNLIRAHMAKMLVEWSQNVIWLEADTNVVCDFDDIDVLLGQDLYDFVIQSCQMGLMWLDNNGNPMQSFYPLDMVTRAQFATVLSRAIWGNYYNGWSPYYEDHLDALNTISVMNNISDPWMLELRWYVMLMLLRANQIIE